MNTRDGLSLMQEQVHKVIANTFSISLADVDSSLEYQSISEWDSMGHVSLMLAIEKNFGFKIDQDKVLELTSAAAIVNYLLEKDNVVKPQMQTTTEANNHVTLHRGLNNVHFDESKIAYIDVKNSKLYYRGYLINDLVEHASYEQVVYLLINGELPDAQQLSILKEKLVSFRELPDDIIKIIQILAKSQTLTHVIRTIVSALSETVDTLSAPDQGIAYIAKIPSIIGAYLACKNERELVNPTEQLSHAEYLFSMLLGHSPDPEIARFFEKGLILQAEHESNAATFAARIAKSAEVELGNAITAAVATFTGPLHGGAILGVVQMLEEISDVTKVKSYIQNRLHKKLPVYGFGHRVYRTEDPRAKHSQKVAEFLSAKQGNTRLLDIMTAIKLEMTDYMEHGININDDFYACVAYSLMGITGDMLVPIFIASRSVGWVAHILEQSGNNILIRPRLKYVGNLDRKIHK